MVQQIIELLYHSKSPMFVNFSPAHLAVLAVPALCIFALIHYRSQLKTPRIERRIRAVLLCAMLLQQFLLYSWYWFAGSFDVKDALPLYPCRISSLLCIILLIRMYKPLFNLLVFLGLPGATLAMLFPDTSHLGFPNVMFTQFFIGHTGILVTTVFLILLNDYVPSKKALKSACVMTTLYMGIVMVVNKLVGGNYAYLHRKPEVSWLNILPPYPYYVPIFILLVFAVYTLIQVIWSTLAQGRDTGVNSAKKSRHFKKAS